MKILHINCSDMGSTGKIIREISKTLATLDGESVLCNPSKAYKNITDGLKIYKTSFPKEQGAYKRVCYFTGYRYGFAPVSTYRIIRIIKKEKPDVVHIHSSNCYMVNLYRLFGFLNKHKYPIVVTNHAEFFYTGNCPHAKDCMRWLKGCGNCPDLFDATCSVLKDTSHKAWTRMRECMQSSNHIRVVSVSPWVFGRSSMSPIMENVPQRAVLNGVDTATFNIGNNDYAPKYLKTVLFVTAGFSENDYSEKGGGYIVDLAKRLKNDQVKIVVIGSAQDCDELPDNVELLGRIDNQQELAEHYRMADLSVIVSKRETFSMPVAESLCCGTPIVGFKAGGPESISIDKYTEFVDYGDLDGLENILKGKWLSFKTREISKKISDEAVKKYSSDRMAKEYISLYEELIDEKNRHSDLS